MHEKLSIPEQNKENNNPDENDILERTFPPTHRSRKLYENENIIL